MDMSKRVDRFFASQESGYPEALAEVRNGSKEGHWMWFIFPQLRGLGQSTMAWYYGIEDLQEAREYLQHPVLGQRLREITQALLDRPETDPVKIFGWTDSMKLRSCMTLFAQVSGDDLFTRVLDKFYGGQEDRVTLELLGRKKVQS